MMRKLIIPVLLIAAAVLANAAEPVTSGSGKNTDVASVTPITKGQRAFTICHSFHMRDPQTIAEIAKSAGISGHEVVGRPSLIGASRIIQHWDITPDPVHRAKEFVASGNVDVVTMSPWTKPDEGIEKFTQLGLEHNPNIRIAVEEFWLPRDSLAGFSQEEQKYARDWVSAPVTKEEYANGASFNTPTAEQLRRLHELYFKTMDEYVRNLNQKIGKQVVFVVPVGQAVIALREKIIAGKAPGIAKQSDLFTDALGHPSPAITTLASYCHFAVIYHRSPVGLPQPKGLAEKYNSEELNRLLQQLAWDAVTHHALSGMAGMASSK